MATSQDVIDLRARPKMGFSLDGGVLAKDSPYLRISVFQIAKNKGLILAGFHARRNETFCEPFVAEIAFLHHSSGTCGVIPVDRCFYERTRVPPVQAPGSVRAGGHAESAADTPVVVHHDDAVRSPKCRLNRTDSDAGRVVAVITKNHERQTSQAVLDVILDVIVFCPWKGMVK